MGINFDLNKGINEKESKKFVRSIILAALVFGSLLVIGSFFTNKDLAIGPKGISVRLRIGRINLSLVTIGPISNI